MKQAADGEALLGQLRHCRGALVPIGDSAPAGYAPCPGPWFGGLACFLIEGEDEDSAPPVLSRRRFAVGRSDLGGRLVRCFAMSIARGMLPQ
jgi:hypothetical protein